MRLNDVPNELAAIAAKPKANANDADELAVEAARLLALTKAQFDRGEFPGTDWDEWSAETLSLSKRRIREIVCIGEAADPLRELRRQRDLSTGRQKRYRARRAGRPHDGQHRDTQRRDGVHIRSRLVEWAKAAPRDDLQGILAFISDLPRETPRAAARRRTARKGGQ